MWGLMGKLEGTRFRGGVFLERYPATQQFLGKIRLHSLAQTGTQSPLLTFLASLPQPSNPLTPFASTSCG